MRTYIRLCACIQEAVYPEYGNIFSVGGSLCRKKRTDLKEKKSVFLLSSSFSLVQIRLTEEEGEESETYP